MSGNNDDTLRPVLESNAPAARAALELRDRLEEVHQEMFVVCRDHIEQELAW